MARYEVRFGGFGGQGIVTMAMVLGEAVSLIEKKECVQTQSYGPEARGGATKSELVIDDEEVDYPKVQEPDVFVAMSRAAYLEYIGGLKKDGILIIDEDLVQVEGDRALGDGLAQGDLVFLSEDRSRGNEGRDDDHQRIPAVDESVFHNGASSAGSGGGSHRSVEVRNSSRR